MRGWSGKPFLKRKGITWENKLLKKEYLHRILPSALRAKILLKIHNTTLTFAKS